MITGDYGNCAHVVDSGFAQPVSLLPDRVDHTGNKQCFRAVGDSFAPISHVADKMVRAGSWRVRSVDVCVSAHSDTACP